MSEDELKAIADRADKASQGPWRVKLSDIWSPKEAWDKGYLDFVDANGQTVVAEWSHYADDAGLTVTREDAEFIAAARSDVPALVAEVRRLRGALESVRDRSLGGSSETYRELAALTLAGVKP